MKRKRVKARPLRYVNGSHYALIEQSIRDMLGWDRKTLVKVSLKKDRFGYCVEIRADKKIPPENVPLLDARASLDEMIAMFERGES
jgi:hypothetical protein